MLVVVPEEEVLTEAACILNRAEAIRIAGPVLHGFKLGFGEGVVVRNMRTAMSLDDAQIGEEQSQGFGRHGRASIGMDGELAGRDVLLGAGIFNELAGQAGSLAWGDHPAGDITAENIEDDVQMVERPFDRTSELGNVPTPELIGGGG